MQRGARGAEQQAGKHTHCRRGQEKRKKESAPQVELIRVQLDAAQRARLDAEVTPVRRHRPQVHCGMGDAGAADTGRRCGGGGVKALLSALICSCYPRILLPSRPHLTAACAA